MFEHGFPPDWTTLKKLIWLKGAGAIAGEVWKTVTGAIVTFVTTVAAPLRKLEATLTPTQDLHGYDAPWPPGGGDNIYPNCPINGDMSSVYVTTSGDTYFLSGTPTAYAQVISSDSFTLPAGTYCWAVFSNTTTTKIQGQLRSTNGGTNYAQISTNNSVAFTLNEETELKPRITISADAGSTNGIKLQLMLITGSSAPSAYKPFSNICPISGHTGATVYRTGKNLLNHASPDYSETLIATDGSASTNPNFNTWEFKKAETYTVAINVTETTNPGRVVVFNADGTVKSATGFTATVGRQSLTFTLTSGEKALVSIRVSATELQAELSESASAYEPYTGTSYPITFPALGDDLLPSTWLNGPITESGSIGTNTQFHHSSVIPANSGEGYVLSYTVGRDGSRRVHGYINGVWSQQIAYKTYAAANGAETIAFTVPSGVNGIAVSVAIADTNVSLKLRTIYGGTLTVNEDGTGTLTANRYCDMFDGSDDESWQLGGTLGSRNWFRGAITYGYINATQGTTGVITDSIAVLPATSDSSGTVESVRLKTAVLNSKEMFLFIPQSEGVSTVEGLRTYLNSNPYQICYPLGTPLTYTLTSEQVGAVITTLYGQNNVWVDESDSITVEYREK